MILVSGEALIDLIPDPEREGAYDARIGGSPFNVAIGLGRWPRRWPTTASIWVMSFATNGLPRWPS